MVYGTKVLNRIEAIYPLVHNSQHKTHCIYDEVTEKYF